MSDWRLARNASVNVLITGDPEDVQHAFALLTPSLTVPIWCWRRDTRLPPPDEVRTLVVHQIDELSDREQRELLSWLELASMTRTRVVSTTSVPIFELVAAGTFCDVLYYRLNIVTWEVAGERGHQGGPERI